MSTILDSSPATSTPVEPEWRRAVLVFSMEIIPQVSVIPYPSLGKRLAHSSITSFPNGAAPDPISISEETSYLSTVSLCFAKAKITGGTANRCVTLYFSIAWRTFSRE